ncbi:DUF4129 domain-containing protein [Fischerella sp. PCC 9605]|uniref:DUF4129 domain-containing protein n=1 Tax=Fischerella sp. PCC 9605 TaxID=1173024 RepID=UPI00047BC8FA|nr:DUF4129 domain-containing protein [Fischerella sp. PCC 9605]
MTTDSFEKTSWGWQISLFQQQVGEWFEYQLSRFDATLPELPSGWSIDPWFISLLKFLFWLGLGLFLAWLVWQLWREFSPYLYSWLARGSNLNNSDAKVQDNELSVANLLARSQEFYRQENYREACRCLYLAMLQHLHEKAILPHKKSRTDGEYLQLLGLSRPQIQPYETLITTHERLCFGSTEILPENYEQCQQAYQEIVNS